jgi:hypothetical protein
MPDYIAQLRFRLLELGCPVARVQRMVREVAEHREDLVQAALAEGWSAPEAGAEADARLGNPLVLAEDLMTSERRAAWCGRHRVIAFGLLPLLTFPILWALILCLDLTLGYACGFGWNHNQLRAVADNPATFQYLVMAVNGANYVAIAMVTFLFCRLAGRSAAGRSWMLLAGLICALYSLFIGTQLSPHNFSLILGSRPHWIQAAIPLLVFGFAHWNQQRRVRQVLKFAAA